MILLDVQLKVSNFFVPEAILRPVSRAFAAAWKASFGKSKCLPELLKDINQHHNRQPINFHVGGMTRHQLETRCLRNSVN